jgi:hypothetical protein
MRKRINRHPWQRIQKPFAFRASRNRQPVRAVVIERKWKAQHPENETQSLPETLARSKGEVRERKAH